MLKYVVIGSSVNHNTKEDAIKESISQTIEDFKQSCLQAFENSTITSTYMSNWTNKILRAEKGEFIESYIKNND